MMQLGYAEEEFQGKPVIGVLNTWSEIDSCHGHFPERAKEVKRGVLQAGGFSVEPVADGNDVLRSARAFGPDLVIMDIQLPNISGLDLITSLKRDRVLTDVPVLAVTAYAGKGDEERIRGAGAAGYLSKPVSIRPFIASVERLFAAGALTAGT